jgi:hypothetical protein
MGTGQDAVHAVFDPVIERCVMVGMCQPGLSAAGTVLKRIAQRGSNPLRLAIGGAIARPGTVFVGAPVRPAGPTGRQASFQPTGLASFAAIAASGQILADPSLVSGAPDNEREPAPRSAGPAP